MSQSVELVLDAKADLGEGAIWDAKRHVLYWVDIFRGELHIYDPTSGHDRSINVGQNVGTVVPRRSGGVMLAVEHGFAGLDLENEEFEIVADPERHLPGSQFNDGKCDPAGRFWAGTHFSGSEQLGSLYRLDPDLSVHRMVEGVKGSNGIAWSLDGTRMYYVDTALRLVYAFDYRVETGEIANRRVAFDVPKEIGYPDGMTIDSEGTLWVALFSGFKVTRWDPVEGRLLQTLDVPALPTSCAFGGENLDQFYITTLRRWQSAEKLERYPLTGGLFVADVGVTGIPAFEFAG